MPGLFKNKPANLLTIDSLIEELSMNHSGSTKAILELLMTTKKFLIATEPLLQKHREEAIADQVIKKILDESAANLESFKTVNSDNAEESELIHDAFDYCKQNHTTRLLELQSNNDKIFTFYSTHDNELKVILEFNASNYNRLY